MVIVVFVYQLEVLNGGLVHAAIEIQYKGLHLLVPLGRFVEEKHDVLRVVDFKLLLDCVLIVLRAPQVLLPLQVHVRQQHLHSAGAFATQDVGFVLHDALLRPQVVLVFVCLLQALPVVED